MVLLLGVSLNMLKTLDDSQKNVSLYMSKCKLSMKVDNTGDNTSLRERSSIVTRGSCGKYLAAVSKAWYLYIFELHR